MQQERDTANTTEQKDPELTSSHGHTQITSIYRTAINEKDQNFQKRLCTTKDIKKELQKEMGWRLRITVQLRPTPPGG